MARRRVAAIEFAHESNTFSVLPTTLDNFHAGHFFVGDEIPQELRDTNSELGGFLVATDAYDWEPVYILAATATPGGPVTESARKHITDEAILRLEHAGPLDGIFIALHGAMVTESSVDGETQFLKQIREIVGDEIPLAITLDLHANIFDQMAEFVDIAVSYRTYPHVDMKDRGEEACGLLQKAMLGLINPALEIARPPMLVGCDEGRTTNNGPMCKLLDCAAQEVKQDGLLCVSINAGFIYVDIPATGPTVLVCYDKFATTASFPEKVAQRIVEKIWELRDVRDLPMPLTECIQQIDSTPSGSGPVVIADYSDNTGGGAYGDCTAILQALLESSVENAALGNIWDPQAAAELASLGVGTETTITIGGRTDPGIGGGPITVTGIITAVSDGKFVYEGPMFAGLPGQLGVSVCFHVDGVDVLVVSERVQVLDKNIFRALRIEPEGKSVLVVKSMQHFRAAFSTIANTIFMTDAGGLCSPDVANRTYKHIRRPILPLDSEEACLG